MPIVNFLCKTCGPFEQYRSVHSQALPPCPSCQVESERHWVTNRTAPSTAPPVVVFRAADGSFRFPGSADGLYAKKCSDEGMTRVELRGWADVRKFEGQVNAQEMEKIHRRVERQQEAFGQSERIRRSALFEGAKNGFQIPEVDEKGNRTGRLKTVHLSPRAKDIMAKLVENNNRKGVRAHAAGFHIDAYSNDRTNREPGRDERGRRQRD